MKNYIRTLRQEVTNDVRALKCPRVENAEKILNQRYSVVIARERVEQMGIRDYMQSWIYNLCSNCLKNDLEKSRKKILKASIQLSILAKLSDEDIISRFQTDYLNSSF